MTWTDPGVHAVAPDVHRIVCPLPGDGLKAVNVYALTGGDGIALIDTGWRSDAIIAALTEGFAALGASLSDLTAIVSTHSHYDHYGLAAHLRELSGAPVCLGEHERANLATAIVREEFERDREHRQALLRRHGARTLADELAAVGFAFEQVQSRTSRRHSASRRSPTVTRWRRSWARCTPPASCPPGSSCPATGRCSRTSAGASTSCSPTTTRAWPPASRRWPAGR
jgi:hypothetical protein